MCADHYQARALVKSEGGDCLIERLIHTLDVVQKSTPVDHYLYLAVWEWRTSLRTIYQYRQLSFVTLHTYSLSRLVTLASFIYSCSDNLFCGTCGQLCFQSWFRTQGSSSSIRQESLLKTWYLLSCSIPPQMISLSKLKSTNRTGVYTFTSTLNECFGNLCWWHLIRLWDAG